LLAQAHFLQKQSNNKVIMLIDDLPAELDTHHRTTLLDLLHNLNIQHLVTTTSLDWIPIRNAASSRIFEIKKGKLEQI